MSLAACGGALVEDDGGSSGSSGSNTGDPISPSWPEGSGGASGDACGTSNIALATVCVPGEAKAGAPITLGVEGSGEWCVTSPMTCRVSVTGTTLVLSTVADQCGDDENCDTRALGACTTPPLAAGTYEVRFDGVWSAGPGGATRSLVVTEDATDTFCALTFENNELEADAFARTCEVDDDCTLAYEGELCTWCFCPNTAIAKSAEPAYAKELRARSSQCPGDGPDEWCPCELNVKARCDTSGTFGKCVATPL